MFEIERKFANQFYLECLYKAILAMMYYGLMRIGEVAKGSHTAKAAHVHVDQTKQKILVMLFSSKTHGKKDLPQKIKITSLKNCCELLLMHRIFCPFKLINQYISVQGPGFKTYEEPFFIFQNREPALLPSHVRTVLRQLLSDLNLDASLYNTHSACTGCACDMWRSSYSLQEICKAGRWRSNAVFKYLRPKI